ncbi:hypothetical protein AAG906_006857 [Vitis piasezkii]
MKFNKKFYKNQESEKGKSPNEKSSNEKRKGSSKGKKVQCFNCRGFDNDSKESASIASKDARYNPNDLLAFIASMESMHDGDCDSNSDDDEFIGEQRAKLLSNLYC